MPQDSRYYPQPPQGSVLGLRIDAGTASSSISSSACGVTVSVRDDGLDASSSSERHDVVTANPTAINPESVRSEVQLLDGPSGYRKLAFVRTIERI